MLATCIRRSQVALASHDNNALVGRPLETFSAEDSVTPSIQTPGTVGITSPSENAL
jgi:hypothetical protein